MTSLWSELAHHLGGGRDVFVALVVEHTRHSPGTTGAGLLVVEPFDENPHLITVGTIGGGVMEKRLIETAAEILRRGEPHAEIADLQHRRRPSSGHPSGLICAGQQTNLYYLCRPEPELATIDALLEARRAGATADVEISPSGWRVVARDFDLQIPPSRLERRRDGDFVYRLELLNRRRLAIFGGGHCGLALARLSHTLGYHIVAFEQTEKAAEGGMEQAVHHLVAVDDFRHAALQVSYPEITEAVVLTSDVASDVRALGGVLRCPFPFIGVLGSAAKIREIRRHLLDEGFNEDDLARLTAPVGLPMQSNTPSEIAVSIAAQLLQRRSD